MKFGGKAQSEFDVEPSTEPDEMRGVTYLCQINLLSFKYEIFRG